MKKALLIFILLLPFSSFTQETCNCPGGSKKGKGTLYGSWGYNRDWYSKSDLHFYDPGSGNYDFTLYGVKAVDRPGFDEILRTMINADVTVPQYVIRLGYYFNNTHDLGVEINFDHSKYIMLNGQTVRIKGRIHDKEFDRDTVLHEKFLKFEHSDGANFLMGNLLKRQTFFRSANSKHWFSIIAKAGAGIVIPKTDVTLFGTRLDNRFHIAGWIAGMETGLRYDFNHFFVEATGKGTFANYRNVLVMGTGKANHRFWCLQAILSAGFQIGL